jgi:chromatin remodeling complex protein RSC6
MLAHTYQVYVEYSHQYFVDLEQLDHFLTSSVNATDAQIADWVSTNSYYVIVSTIGQQFQEKITHNLHLAQLKNDQNYLEYLKYNLNLTIDEKAWTYTPIRLKLRLKCASASSHHYKISKQLSTFLRITHNTTYRYVSDILRSVHRYIYDHHLQDAQQHNKINPNDALKSILTPLEPDEPMYTYHNLVKHIQHHIEGTESHPPITTNTTTPLST